MGSERLRGTLMTKFMTTNFVASCLSLTASLLLVPELFFSKLLIENALSTQYMIIKLRGHKIAFPAFINRYFATEDYQTREMEEDNMGRPENKPGAID